MSDCRENVLIVDDDQEITLGARLRLEAAGYAVLVAADGAEGVALAMETTPDLIVMDIQMPGVDGLTALTQLQSNPDTRQIPVVVLSASLRTQRAALDSGARFFLKKPYHGQQLIGAVGKAIAQSVQGESAAPNIG